MEKTSRLKLGRLAFIVMGMTVLSRMFGFVRDIILAQVFGASAAFDAFIIAFKIPNFLRRLFGEGAFSQAFIPTLVQYRTRHSHHQVKQFINQITGVFGLVLLLIVIAGEIGAPLLVMIFAPGFADDPERFQLTHHLIQITFPYFLAIGLTALAGAILNTYNRFAISAFTPVLLNWVLIAVAWWWTPHVSPSTGIYLLAWGVLISGVIQLAFQIPALRALNLLPKPQWQWRDSGVRQVMIRLLPALLGVSFAQISLLINNLFASFLPAGSISWLYYADRLIYLPLGIIGVALSTVVMPNLSRQHQLGNWEHYTITMDWALRCILLMAIPAAIGLFLLSGPIISTLFHHGSFTVDDVVMTQRSLMAFSIGLPAYMLIKILASAFYTQHNVKAPVKIVLAALFLNLILNFIFINILAHVGLALSTAIASWFNAVLLWLFLLKQGSYRCQTGWLRLLASIFLASSAMVLLLKWATPDFTQWLNLSLWQGVCRLFLLIVLGGAVYFTGLLIAGIRWNDFRAPELSEKIQ